VEDLVQDLLRKGPLALRAALRSVIAGEEKSLPEAMAMESKLFGDLLRTEDCREGLRAFLERRRPEFRGK
jgi:enoyl-CoA hydratase/carnithine racemase